MKLYHTSPVEITKIEQYPIFGNFNDCLFFSSDIYYMTASNDAHVYSIDIEDDSFIDVSELYDADAINEISEKLSIDLDLAESIFIAETSIFELSDNSSNCEDLGEFDHYIQNLRGQCANKMGYLGCKDKDEQGTVYIIPMLEKEKLLNKE